MFNLVTQVNVAVAPLTTTVLRGPRTRLPAVAEIRAHVVMIICDLLQLNIAYSLYRFISKQWVNSDFFQFIRFYLFQTGFEQDNGIMLTVYQ